MGAGAKTLLHIESDSARNRIKTALLINSVCGPWKRKGHAPASELFVAIHLEAKGLKQDVARCKWEPDPEVDSSRPPAHQD